MNEALKQFLMEVRKDEEKSSKFDALVGNEASVEELVEFAKECGVDLTEEDLKSLEISSELSVDDLENVTGGKLNSDGTFTCPFCNQVFRYMSWSDRLMFYYHLLEHGIDKIDEIMNG